MLHLLSFAPPLAGVLLLLQLLSSLVSFAATFKAPWLISRLCCCSRLLLLLAVQMSIGLVESYSGVGGPH